MKQAFSAHSGVLFMKSYYFREVAYDLLAVTIVRGIVAYDKLIKLTFLWHEASLGSTTLWEDAVCLCGQHAGTVNSKSTTLSFATFWLLPPWYRTESPVIWCLARLHHRSLELTADFWPANSNGSHEPQTICANIRLYALTADYNMR